MSRWFRMYAEVVNDPKVQKLTPEIFKFWINLMCICSASNGNLPVINDISFVIREKESKIKRMLAALEEAGLVDAPTAQNPSYSIHSWETRQFKSDSSAERVKRHRQQKCNVTETPPEQNRTETDTEEVTSVTSPPTPKGAFKLPDWIPAADWHAYVEMRQRTKKALTATAKQMAVDKLEKLKAQGCDPGAVLKQSIFNSWQGLFPPKENHDANTNSGTPYRGPNAGHARGTSPRESEWKSAADAYIAENGGMEPAG